jgi:TatA/E family protein of Tat protein translocase
LVIIGIIALVVFGPRKLPELGRKAGKLMAEFRSATSDFKATWEKEVAELKDDVKDLDSDTRMLAFLENPKPVANSISRNGGDSVGENNGVKLELPAVKEMPPPQITTTEQSAPVEAVKPTKKDWL